MIDEEFKEENYSRSSGFYAIIPMVILEDFTISALAKIVYGKVSSLCVKKGYCWATNSTIGEHLGKKKGIISQCISSLIKKGYLFSDLQAANNKSYIRKLYIMLPCPAKDSLMGGYQEIDRGLSENKVGAIKKLIDTTIINNYNKVNNVHFEKNGFFEELWKEYPNRTGKKQAFRYYTSSVRTEQDKEDIKKALYNYKNSVKVLKGYIMNGATWFNNWRDYVNWEEPDGRPKGIFRESGSE